MRMSARRPGAAFGLGSSFTPIEPLMRKFVLQCLSVLLSVLMAAAPAVALAEPDPALWLDRITWGANASALHDLQAQGFEAYLRRQLDPNAPAALPAPVQARIDAMAITRRPLTDLVRELEAQRTAAEAIADPQAKKAARQAVHEAAGELAREAAARHLLRAVYSPAQLREQMTWFWFNHFNVFGHKPALRAFMGDYEERAIRAHALGRFRDLLGATLHHPAVLIYLDNARNADGQINENYARELLELHTLGVDGGYTQRDVQALAHVLTGVGVLPLKNERAARTAVQVDGLFAYFPKRHDHSDKQLLGHTIKGRGYPEIDEVLDLLARHPSTARHLSTKLAQYFVSDAPPPALIESMAQTYLRTDGDIAAVLSTLFHSDEFQRSLGKKFKDPMHYLVSAARQGDDGRNPIDTDPMLKALQRLGEPLYGHQTPDGYPMDMAAWSSAGQMTTRFEIARGMGRLMPSLKTPFFDGAIAPRLGAPTRSVLDATRPADQWNTHWLSSPEFMQR